MDGIKKKMDPGDQVRDDIFKMTKSDREKKEELEFFQKVLEKH